jgi:hypothetical protein
MVTGKLEARIISICANPWGRLAGCFSRSRSSPNGFSRIQRQTGAIQLNFQSTELCRKTLPNEIDWYITGPVECPATLLRRINSMDKPNGRLVLVS